MKIILLTLSFLFLSIPNDSVLGDGYQIGDVATDFSLPNVDGKMVSLSDFADAKGLLSFSLAIPVLIQLPTKIELLPWTTSTANRGILSLR